MALSWIGNITICELDIYAAPSRGRKRQVSYTVLGPCYYLHRFHSEFQDLLSSFSVGYKSESNDANDSKKEGVSQLIRI